jgi:hypothetical protein
MGTMRLGVGRRVLAIGLAVVLLAGCGGPGATGMQGAVPQGVMPAGHSAHGGSLSPATSNDLLYVTDGVGTVYVLTYPAGNLVQTLGVTAAGICSDPQGNVFMTQPSASSSTIVEYAHGGTQPFKTLVEPDYGAWGCGVDPATENLAVANYGIATVAVFANASGTPTIYAMPIQPRYMGYDNKSNLFAFGFDGHATLAELANHGSAFKKVIYQKNIFGPMGVQWDGKYLALGEGTNVNNCGLIRRYTITNFNGKWKGGTKLNCQARSFFIQGSTVLTSWNGIYYYHYPAGGQAYKTVKTAAGVGMTISLAPSHSRIRK